jgi:hypothetical protein
MQKSIENRTIAAMRVFLAATLVALLGACASTGTVPHPTALNHGLLAARARVRGALIPFTADVPDRAAIELLDEFGSPVPGKIAVTASSVSGTLYFLDLPPGRYSLTELSFAARGARYEVILSSAAMRKNSVVLRPGTAAFLGDLVLDGRYPEFDVAVERALEIVGHWVTPFLRRPVIARDADLRTHALDANSEAAVMRAARRDLAGTPWSEMADTRLREMGAPAPAARAGLRNREVPLRTEAQFSWRDTLRWGEPARSSEGLVWREPSGESRIAIFFTSATAPGFIGYDEAVAQLHRAAGSTSDSSVLYEVRVGTRTGVSAKTTSFRAPAGVLTGSDVSAATTETVLVADARGMYTARLRAPQGRFDKLRPQFRAFLLQLILGPPAKPAPKEEVMLPP